MPNQGDVSGTVSCAVLVNELLQVISHGLVVMPCIMRRIAMIS